MRRNTKASEHTSLAYPNYPSDTIFYLTLSVSPNVAGVLCHHGLACFAAPGLLKLRHVLYHAVHAILARRVWIGKHSQPRNLRTPLLAPYSPESQEEALLRCVAIDLLAFFSSLVVGNHVLKRRQRDASSAVVGGILAQREFAI